MKDLNRDEYPLLKPGHSTSTLLVCMFLGFALGFLACHKVYSGIDKSQNISYTDLEVNNDQTKW